MIVSVVHDLRGVRQQFADPRARLPVLLELEDGARHREGALPRRHAGDALAHANAAGQFGAGELVERRLVVEQIHLRGAARLVQEDHALGLGREMRQARQTAGRVGLRRGEAVLRQQRTERGDPDAGAAAREEMAPGDVHTYSLVMVSSRLRMVLATVVHAASSTASTLPAFDAPTAISFAAAAGSFL